VRGGGRKRWGLMVVSRLPALHFDYDERPPIHPISKPPIMQPTQRDQTCPPAEIPFGGQTTSYPTRFVPGSKTLLVAAKGRPKFTEVQLPIGAGEDRGPAANLCISPEFPKDGMPMGIVKLLRPPEFADGSHQIGSPGGYECWHFYAEDASQNVRAAAAFHDGFATHPEYVRRYAAYRRSPTRNAPAVPSEFPCVQVGVFEEGKRLETWTTYFPAGSFRAEGSGIGIGSSRADFRAQEIVVAISEARQSIELNFRPTTPAAPELSYGPNGEHRWIPARPRCEVEGKIQIAGRDLSIRGIGQHNHWYGTAPVPGRWVRGSVLLHESAVMFHGAGDQAIVIGAKESAEYAIERAPFIAEWKAGLLDGMSHPSTMNIGERLVLRNGRIIWQIEGQLKLIYDAYIDGEQATAWVEIDGR
jgi:hypothetical protein